MTTLESTLLHGWRALAFVGHYGGMESLGERGSNKILRYHSVGGNGYDDISPAYLRRQIEFLDSEYEVVDLPEALTPGRTKRVALTFDDGAQDFYDNVVPVLHEFDVPATVFVIADALTTSSYSHTDDFHYEYMGLDELSELVDDPLVTVGNHTRSHPNLRTVDAERLPDEIVGSRETLEDLLDVDVTRFCYPYGAFDDRAAELVRETHDIGVGGRGRREAISWATDPAQVPRVNGANPHWEVSWDLSDTATRIGTYCDRFLGSV